MNTTPATCTVAGDAATDSPATGGWRFLPPAHDARDTRDPSAVLDRAVDLLDYGTANQEEQGEALLGGLCTRTDLDDATAVRLLDTLVTRTRERRWIRVIIEDWFPVLVAHPVLGRHSQIGLLATSPQQAPLLATADPDLHAETIVRLTATNPEGGSNRQEWAGDPVTPVTPATLARVRDLMPVAVLTRVFTGWWQGLGEHQVDVAAHPLLPGTFLDQILDERPHHRLLGRRRLGDPGIASGPHRVPGAAAGPGGPP